MFEAIVGLVVIGILAVEVIEVRHKCSELPVDNQERAPLRLGIGLGDGGRWGLSVTSLEDGT
jgi:hypothetical protein